MQLPITRCVRCQQSTLRAFASLAGISIPVRPPNRFAGVSGSSPSRSFASSARWLDVERSTHQTEPERPSSTATTTTATFTSAQAASKDESSSSSSTLSSSSIPWYLQIETPTPPAPSTPQLARQEIPTIPSDAPDFLSPILHHLSDQVGLDNLSLIDLRHLDPPAALGANLLMIIGTARSYKHLNTSADRFCRWLRSRYKLSPYADGLLGRNELKLKLRRKARKLKLAQSVGNTVAASGMDDGITTGWICVNVGRVDQVKMWGGKNDHSSRLQQLPQAVKEEIDMDHEDEGEQQEEEEYQNPDTVDEVDEVDGYIGFGSRSTAPRIVVQMFTEEKRLEMDLEGLWDHRQHKRAQKEEKNEAAARRDIEEAALNADSTGSAAIFKPWT